MKKITAFMLLLMLCGCTKGGYADVQDKLTSMKSYRCTADITYINSRGESSYGTRQTALSDGRYRIETTSPPEYSGSVIVYDGKMIWQYNPLAPQNKVHVSADDKSERAELLLFSFIENFNRDNSTAAASAVKNADMGKTTVLTAQINDGGALVSEKLWTDSETMLPKRLVVYNDKGEERIVEEFSDFEYNCAVDEENDFTVGR